MLEGAERREENMIRTALALWAKKAIDYISLKAWLIKNRLEVRK